MLAKRLRHLKRSRFSVCDMQPWQGDRWRFTLDGKPVSDVVAASLDEGWVERYATPNGHPVLDETGQRAIVERLEGHVEVIDRGTFWRELCGAINTVTLEWFGRTVLPGGWTPYRPQDRRINP